jgi:glucokinase
MLLAGDVGGTKTLLGLFERSGGRPLPFAVRAYVNQGFRAFGDILDTFARDLQQPFSVDAAALGVAGPVTDGQATLTNVEWRIDAREVAARFAAPKAELLNDLEAMAYGIAVLTPAELLVLQPGDANPHGNAAVIAAGTGLGEAMLHREGRRHVPVASEGGHADFAARSDREMELVRMLRDRYGRAEVEHVVSGPGLLNLHHFTHNGETCVAVGGRPLEESPAAITDAAI